MVKRSKPYLQLVRLPNLFTAAADSLAGWLLARGDFQEPARWGALVGASVALYAAGVVLNDLCDLEVDRRERPGRPLPSGRVPRGVAAGLALLLSMVGLALAFAARTPHGATVAPLIVVAVLGYDLGLKKTSLGPEMMGLCRALNFLLGLSVAPDFGGVAGWLAAASYGTYVCGVTWISRNEAEAAKRFDPTVILGMALQQLAVLGQLGAGLLALAARSGPLLEGALGLLILAALATRAALAGTNALRVPSPQAFQRAVKSGILSLVWLHVGLLLMARGPTAAAAVALLWFPALLAGRWVHAT